MAAATYWLPPAITISTSSRLLQHSSSHAAVPLDRLEPDRLTRAPTKPSAALQRAGTAPHYRSYCCPAGAPPYSSLLVNICCKLILLRLMIMLYCLLITIKFITPRLVLAPNSKLIKIYLQSTYRCNNMTILFICLVRTCYFMTKMFFLHDFKIQDFSKITEF